MHYLSGNERQRTELINGKEENSGLVKKHNPTSGTRGTDSPNARADMTIQ